MSTGPVTAFAPATVANVGCGFDIMGFALTGIGDRVTITLQADNFTSMILRGPYAAGISAEYHKNTAGVAINHFLNAGGYRDIRPGIALEKNLPLSSGLGSSAASAAAALFALNDLLGNPLTVKELIPFAMEGERAACGTAHADNVAPSLLGGFVLIRSYDPLDIIQITSPDDLYCAVVHPHIEIRTSDARRILKHDIPIGDVTKQSANSAAFIAGLFTEDYELLGRSMNDLLAEPKRTQLIPGFDRAKRAAMDAGAIGCGISGSGPSVFALSRGEIKSSRIAEAIKRSFLEAGLDSDAFVSPLNAPGAHIIPGNVI